MRARMMHHHTFYIYSCRLEAIIYVLGKICRVQDIRAACQCTTRPLMVCAFFNYVSNWKKDLIVAIKDVFWDSLAMPLVVYSALCKQIESVWQRLLRDLSPADGRYRTLDAQTSLIFLWATINLDQHPYPSSVNAKGSHSDLGHTLAHSHILWRLSLKQVSREIHLLQPCLLLAQIYGNASSQIVHVEQQMLKLVQSGKAFRNWTFKIIPGKVQHPKRLE